MLLLQMTMTTRLMMLTLTPSRRPNTNSVDGEAAARAARNNEFTFLSTCPRNRRRKVRWFHFILWPTGTGV